MKNIKKTERINSKHKKNQVCYEKRGKKTVSLLFVVVVVVVVDVFFYFSFFDCGPFSDYKLTICDFSANLLSRNANATNIFNVKSV